MGLSFFSRPAIASGDHPLAIEPSTYRTAALTAVKTIIDGFPFKAVKMLVLHSEAPL